jgi:5'-3' exonuclease
MGIDNFNSWLIKNYPNCILPYKNNRKYDYLYVDVNHLLHNSIHNCGTEKIFFKNLYHSLNNIFNNFIAIKKVVLAVDGPSPYSKVILQRKRRLQAVRNIDVNKINSLYLTPGTELMMKLGDKLVKFVDELKKKYKYLHVDFIISPPTEPDEGELKIFSKLIEFGKKNPYSTHLIIGNDADLVVMAMAAKPTYNINLLIRIPSVKKNERCLISIKKIIKIHAKKIVDLSRTIVDHKIYFNILNLKNSNLRDDFCALSIMMGNDYLPKINYVTKFEVLWLSYVQTRRALGKNTTLIKNGKYNIMFFKRFIFYVNSNISNQFKKFSFKKYDDALCANYINGVLWCLNMYRTGKCSKYDYIYTHNSGPTPINLMYYLELNLDNNAHVPIPISNTQPLTIYACALLLIPKKGRNLIPDIYQPLIDEDLSKMMLYDEEDCITCDDLKEILSIYYKNMFKARKDGLDTENIRKSIGTIMSSLSKHKKNHNNKLSLSDINKVVNLVDNI